MTFVSKRRLFTVVLAMFLAGAVVPLTLQAQGASSHSSPAKKHTKHHRKSAKAAKAKASHARSSAASMEKNKAKSEKKSRRHYEKKAKSAAAGQGHSMARAAEGTQSGMRTEAKGATRRHESMGARTPPSPGMVWVSSGSKVYHKPGSRWYGKTKSGKWMTEADAQRAGYKAAKN